MKQYFIVDKETKHMVGNTVYGSAKMADMDIEKMEGGFKKYEVYAFDMNNLTKDLIVYAMTNDNLSICVNQFWNVRINDKKFEYMENVNEVVKTILDNV